jgi:hypothetical protein
VRKQYSGLKAYAVLHSGGAKFGYHPLIYWDSEDKGIAFEFSYQDTGQYMVDRVIVFQAGSNFLPEGCVERPQVWQMLPPYALEAGSDGQVTPP